MLSSLIILVIYIFNVNVYVTDIHADHFLDGARNILLDVAADLADINIFLKDKMQDYLERILLRFNADVFVSVSLNEESYTPRERR